jgi:xanthine/uracil permease
MRYWWRELGGWLLIAAGLLCFLVVWQFCKKHYVVEAWPIALIGIVIFWGGIHLLKVAIAARICQQAQDRLYPVAKTKGERPA